MLFSRQSTLDDLDGPDSVPKTSERARPRLRKMQSMDMSSSSADSGSIVSRCLTHACFVHSLFTHTIIVTAVYMDLCLQTRGVQSGSHGYRKLYSLLCRGTVLRFKVRIIIQDSFAVSFLVLFHFCFHPQFMYFLKLFHNITLGI